MSKPATSETDKRDVIFYHDHMVDSLVEKAGKRRASRLLHDAAIGGRAQQEYLGKACHGEIIQSMYNGKRIYSVQENRKEASWWGNILILDHQIPQTFLETIYGKKLGEVVEGVGAKNHIIVEAEGVDQGTVLIIKTSLLRADKIKPTPFDQLTGPLRRLCQNVHAKWQDTFTNKKHHQKPTLRSIGLEALLLFIMLIAGVMGLLMTTAFNVNPGIISCITIVPVWLLWTWAAAGMIASIKIDIQRYIALKRSS